jgi:Mce-associated membrane protein
MPPGANSGKETTEVPEDTATDYEQTTSTGEEPVEKAVEVTESTGESSAESAQESSTEPAEDSGEDSEPAEESSTEPAEDSGEDSEPAAANRRIDWSRVVAYGVLPAVALLLAMAAGYLKWEDNSARDTDITSAQSPASEAMRTAKDSTIAMLSYKPDTVDKQLNDARNLLTGEFRDSYTSLINDVVIPGAKQKQISAVASVPALASVSADPNHAVVLVFVNQTVVVGQSAPTDTASSVRVTMEKVGGRWLIAKFDPV